MKRHRHLVEHKSTEHTLCGLLAERAKTSVHLMFVTCAECCQVNEMRRILGKDTVDFLRRTEARMLGLYPLDRSS